MKTLNETKQEMKKFEKLVEVIAATRILNKKTSLTFEAETARIERCVEHFYKTQDFDEDFYEFGIAFIKELANEMIFTSDYDGMFLNDVVAVA